MMGEVTLQTVLYVAGIFITVVITFFTTKHGLRSYIRDKNDELKKEIIEMRLEAERIKGDHNLQKHVTDQIRKELDALIPDLVKALKERKDA